MATATTIGTLGNDTLDLSNAAGGPFNNEIVGDGVGANMDWNGPGTLKGGDDTIYGGSLGDKIYGDVHYVLGGTVVGGNDIIHAGDGDDQIWGDVYNGGLGAVMTVGGNNTIYGEGGNDLIRGGLGTDTIDGGSGIDTIAHTQIGIGGAGDPRIVVDLEMGRMWSDYYGNDTLISIENVAGTRGNDWIGGSSVANELDGGAGDDVMHGFGGNDIVSDYGGGNNALYGDDGDDTVTSSGSGNDWLSGGDGNDKMSVTSSGAANWVAVHGDAGNDILDGSTASAAGLYGGDGDDLIRFGKGTLYMDGGAGHDIFAPTQAAVTAPGSFGQVFGFEVGIDKLSLAYVTGLDRSGVDIRDWGDNTGIVFTNTAGQSTTLMLMGVTASELDLARDFILAV